VTFYTKDGSSYCIHLCRLHSLPVLEDTDEVPHVYDYLCDLIERNHPMVLGVNNSNLPNLIQIMTDVFVKNAIKIEHIVARRMITIIREIQVAYVG